MRARLEALEAEVRAEAATKATAKAAALERLRAQRAAALEERADDDDVPNSLALASRRGSDLGQTLELARRAADAKDELTRPRGPDEKSWMMSGGLSLLFGPVGWLYAGSFREAIPGSAAYLVAAAVVSKIIPTFLLLPVLLFALPVSGIAGILYAVQYNRKGGKRQRLFGKAKDKALADGKKPKR